MFQLQKFLNQVVYKTAFLIGCIHNLPLGFLKHALINEEYTNMVQTGLRILNEKIDRNNLFVGMNKFSPELNGISQNLSEIETITALLKINYEKYLLTNLDQPVDEIFQKIINNYKNNNEFSKVSNNNNNELKYLFYGTSAFSLGAITAYCLIH